MLQPDEALYSLLCKYLLNEADGVERRWVETWRTENTANEEVLSAIRSMLDAPAPAITYPGLDTDSSWERLKRGITGSGSSGMAEWGGQGRDLSAHFTQDRAVEDTAAGRETVVLPRRRYRWLQVAAAVLVLGGLGFWLSTRSGAEQVVFSGAQQAALEDGSKVMMEQGALMELSADFGKKERRVAFSGKAVFDIAQQAGSPFVIVLGKTEIKVLGTRFTVDYQPENNDLTVHVSNGRIMVINATKGENVILSGGMLLKQDEPQQPFEVAAHVKDIAKRSLVFRDVPLQEVLQTLKAVYGITVNVEDTALLRKEVTANFENEPIENIMETIAFMTNTRVDNNGEYDFSIR
ncbi:FecR family protein [Chitinophaga sp. XS-30]|uniref:FecR family protein n=1 Tax=Chitinophaga sp. XS-30 TaxID=2604421 RepID=UPI0011DCCB64|nr:FecR domain-containing protein [Chitinophaga sp. XS-30]QEH43832.1 DUF4974 domain-containing protein [Chitinophaga sp. XS-30]